MSEAESRRRHQRSRIRLAGRLREVDSGRAALVSAHRRKSGQSGAPRFVRSDDDRCRSYAVAQAFHDGVANRDAGALSSLYADGGRFLPPGMEPCEGRAEIQAAMQQLLDMGAISLDIEPRCS